MSIQLWLQVFGGLAIFLFAMKMMSDGLHQVAGERMRTVLRLFSANRFVAIASGTAVTAVIQSSSASTVMVIGFVNAGLLTLVQAIGIIFGANIGTTITAQIVAFDIEWIIMPSIILGMLLSFLPRPKIQSWGMAIIGLGFLFLGMQLMSDTLKGLTDDPRFMKVFQTFEFSFDANGYMPLMPLLGAVVIGMIATFVLQSSSACTGIILALAMSNALNLETATVLVLGSNVGTTITAQLASIPANRVAKQTALAHTLFNVIGVVVAIVSFYIVVDNQPVFFYIIKKISGDEASLPRLIANAHTVFNVGTTLLLVAFIPALAKICERAIPVKEAKIKYQRLEPRLLDTPSIALTQTVGALRKMLQKAWGMVDCALTLQDPANTENNEKAKDLEQQEADIDERQKDIADYLALLMLRPLTSQQAAQIPLLLHCANDAERIGDHTAIIKKLIEDFNASKATLSDEAKEEFTKLHSLLNLQARYAASQLEKHSQEIFIKAIELKQEIYVLAENYESNHLRRVNEKLCTPASGIFYLELLAEIRKVAHHLGNITERSETFYENPVG